MARLFYRKSRLTLWLNNEIFLGASDAAIWRVIWGKPTDRIILNIDMPVRCKALFELETFNLGMFFHEVGRLDTLNNATPVMTFENCRLNRRWMPQPMTLEYSDNIAQLFAEFTCKIVEHNG